MNHQCWTQRTQSLVEQPHSRNPHRCGHLWKWPINHSMSLHMLHTNESSQIQFKIFCRFSPNNHFHWINPIPKSFITRNWIINPAVFVSYFCSKLAPFAHRRVLHDINVHFFTRQCHHVQWAVHEPSSKRLRMSFSNNHVIGTVIGSNILNHTTPIYIIYW